MEWVDKFEEKINKEWEELQHKPQWSKEVLSKEEVVELLKSIEVEDSKVDESLKSIKGVNGRSFGFNQANKEWRAARDKVIRNLTTKSMEKKLK